MTSVHRTSSECRSRITVRSAERSGRGRTMWGRRQSPRRRSTCRVKGEVGTGPALDEALRSPQRRAKIRKETMRVESSFPPRLCGRSTSWCIWRYAQRRLVCRIGHGDAHVSSRISRLKCQRQQFAKLLHLQVNDGQLESYHTGLPYTLSSALPCACTYIKDGIFRFPRAEPHFSALHDR